MTARYLCSSLRRVLLVFALALTSCGQQAPEVTKEAHEPAKIIKHEQTADEAVAAFQQSQIDAIAKAYDTDQRDLASRLGALGYRDLNGFSAENVSAEALLEHAARRAEAGHRDDGQRLIAWLATQVQENSAIAATDPVLASLNAYSPDELAKPFSFSADLPRVAAIQLPEAVERAVVALAAHGWPHASMSAVLLRSLHKLGFGSDTLDGIAKDAPSLAEYLRRALAAGTPPPLPGDAVLSIIAEVQSASALALTDPALNGIKAELEAHLPPVYDAMLRREALTPTARAELVALRDGARKEGLPLASFKGWRGNDPGGAPADPRSPPPDGPPPFSGALAIDGNRFDGSGQRHVAAARAAYEKWDKGTFGSGWDEGAKPARPNSPPADLPPISGQGGGGGGGGGGNPFAKGGGGESATRPAPSFSRGGLPRSFATASRSMRGPGGISLGATSSSQIADRPVSARWLPKPGAPQFGYFLITMRDGSGATYSALSRLFFAESGDAAHRAVFGSGQDRAFAFKEGDIFPMVSLTPEGSEEDLKAVVVNPALGGLKLAWSAVRSDFWLRSFEGALEDATVLDPNVSSASAKADVAKFDAFTWQIRERRNELRLIRSNGVARILSCIPGLPCTPDTYPAGFEIALFTELPLLGDCEGEPDCTPQAALAKVQAARPRSLEQVLSRVPPEQHALVRAIYPTQVQRFEARRQELIVNLRQRPGETVAAWNKRLTDPDPHEPGKHSDADAASRYIAWLTAHHPDFIRLNDFEHALALMRWLARENATVTNPGTLFAPRPYPIPNRIRGGQGGTALEAFVGDAAS